MSDVVIRVENLGKKYIIGHEKQECHSTVRDSIVNSWLTRLTPTHLVRNVPLKQNYDFTS